MRWLGLVSLTALAVACSGSEPGPLPGNNQGGSSAGTTTASVAGGGSGSMPQAGSSSSGGANGGTTANTAGSAGAGVIAGSSGSGSGGGAGGMITAPEGKIPNTGSPADTINLPRDDWREGLISPTLEEGHHQNQPIVLHGYVQGAGNAEIVFYDISDPTKPKMLSRKQSPGFDPKAGPKGVGEAESHQTSLARYGNKFYQVTTAGTGVDIWDVTNPHDLRHIKLVKLAGVNYGDFTEAVWGMYWQGTTIYVGGTNTGLHVLDATDPEDVKVVKTVPTGQFGSISAGPLWAVGNRLVITTPKDSGGIAIMDITDPLDPQRDDAITPSKSYICGLYGKHVYMQEPLRLWDVLSNDKIGSKDAPLATLPNSAFTAKGYSAASEYMSFSDGYLYLGHLRPDAGVSKIKLNNLTDMAIESRIWGRLEFTNGDDQFSIKVGSLLVLADDELPYRGMVIAAHSTEPDTVPPTVDTVLPKDGATGLAKTSRIGLSLTDNIELATVHPGSVIVRPMGGEPIKGTFGLYMTVLNFDPDEDLLPNTTYEVVLPKDGVKDLVGNGLAAEFKSTFTTGP
jgi:hypothetical protein